MSFSNKEVFACRMFVAGTGERGIALRSKVERSGEGGRGRRHLQYRLGGQDVATDRALRGHPDSTQPHDASGGAARRSLSLGPTRSTAGTTGRSAIRTGLLFKEPDGTPLCTIELPRRGGRLLRATPPAAAELARWPQVGSNGNPLVRGRELTAV
jgi:hypothetical protein